MQLILQVEWAAWVGEDDKVQLSMLCRISDSLLVYSENNHWLKNKIQLYLSTIFPKVINSLKKNE